jgi:hypothetical protein
VIEPAADVVHMRWFPLVIPELKLNTQKRFCFREPQDTLRFSFVRMHYREGATAPTTVRQTLRRGDLERALGEDIWCVK